MYKAIQQSLIALTAILIFPSCGYSQMETAVDIERSFSGIEEIEINGGFLEVTYEGRENDREVFLNAYWNPIKKKIMISSTEWMEKNSEWSSKDCKAQEETTETPVSSV